jgi:DNA mismatch endonuclease (patch repair protein)
MTDIFSKEKRSEVMSKVRSKNTTPEVIVRKFLFSKGLRFRIHEKRLPGHPDIVLKKFRTIILVHGCFWHGHQDALCKLSRLPKSNILFWEEKISRNSKKDSQNLRLLQGLGWSVLTIWECQLRGRDNIQKTLQNLYVKIINPT